MTEVAAFASEVPEHPLSQWPVVPELEVGLDEPEGFSLQGAPAKALLMLVEGRRIGDIAEALEVHRTTVYRWTTDPDFQRELNLLRDRMIEETFSLQVLASKRASLRLLELIDDDDVRIALSAIKTAAPLKEVYVSLDRERRVRFLEDNLEFAS